MLLIAGGGDMDQLYVPDPSVIVKWALPPAEDKGQDRSLDLLQLWLEGGCEFLLPSLWLPEVASLLMQHYPQRAAELLELLIGFDFPEARNSPALYRKAQQLAQQQGVGYYGALYHAVALLHNGTLVTSSAAYWRKARTAGGLMLLKDLKPS